MNIKSFCVMALVAAGAVFSLSGCGGGGDENRGDSYVSLKKFAAGAVNIYSVNTRSLEITPVSKISDQNMPTIDIPKGAGEDGEGLQYQADGAVMCSGTIGVRRGQSYDAELLYQVSEEAVGCVTPIITDSDSLDDTPMLNALGYSSPDEGSGNLSYEGYKRVQVTSWSDLGIQILLDFKAGRMTIYTSGTGFVVTYTDSDGEQHEGVYPGSLVSAAVTFPYIVEKR